MKSIPMFKYRGKMVGFFGGWFEYGSHVHEFYKVSHDDGTFESTTYDRHFIVTKEGEKHQVDPSTLGVCWGRKDKNGKDVFTGHWLKVKTQRSQEYGPDKPYEDIMQVVWRPEFESFCLETKEDQEAIKSGSNHYKYAFDPEYRDNDRVYFTSQVEDYEIEIIEEE